MNLIHEIFSITLHLAGATLKLKTFNVPNVRSPFRIVHRITFQNCSKTVQDLPVLNSALTFPELQDMNSSFPEHEVKMGL